MAPRAVKQRADLELSAALGKEDSPLRQLIAGVALAHRHLVGALVRARRCHRQRVADGPEAQKANSELSLQAIAQALGLQAPLDGVADMRRDVLEVWQPRAVARHAVAVVLDQEIVSALLAAACDGDHVGVGVDAVLDELRNRLERVALRSAMIRMAFQSSPILSLPPSDVATL